MAISPIAAGAGRASSRLPRLGVASLFWFAAKNWYLVFIFFSLFPVITASIQTTIETQNPIYPFTQLGLSLANADELIYQDVETLRTNPQELLGIKPSNGIINLIKYYFGIFLFWWKIIGQLFLITVPFAIAYTYFKWKGTTGGIQASPSSNINSSFWVGLLFIFVVNLVLIIVGLIDGSIALTFEPNMDIFQKVLFVVIKTIPFHGVLNLILYFFGYQIF